MAYPNNKDKGWYADWRLPNRKRRRKLMPNKALAEQYESQQKLKIMRGEVGIVDSEPVTLREFFNRYFERHTKINKKASAHVTEPFMIRTLRRLIRRYRQYRRIPP